MQIEKTYLKAGATLALLALAYLGIPAQATVIETNRTLQAFLCDSADGGSVTFRAPMVSEIPFVIPGTNKVVDVVDGSTKSPLGVAYSFDTSDSKNFTKLSSLAFYFKGAIRPDGITVHICTQGRFGFRDSFDLPAYKFKISEAANGWSIAQADLTKTIFIKPVPISKISIFVTDKRRNASTNLLTFGEIVVNNAPVSANIITDMGDCQVGTGCP